MKYEVMAVDEILQFDIHDDINIIQGESGADTFTIIIPLSEDNLNYADMSYTLKGTVGSYEVREVLSKVVTENEIRLTWSPRDYWTIVYGTLRLTLIATEDIDGELVIDKWYAPEGLEIQKSRRGTNNLEEKDVAYQLLEQMQHLAASVEAGNIKISHNFNTLDRNAPDAHSIDAITGLREELDSKSSIVLNNARAGNLLAFSAENEISDSGHCCDDFVLSSNLESRVKEMDVAKTYIHRQGTAESVWHIHHTLDKMPSVTVIDSAGNVVVGDVSYKSSNYITVSFNGAFSGKCYLN